MGQIIFNGQKPKYCNLSAVTTGSKKDYVIPAGEIWMIDSTNASKTDGSGKYDKYIVGDGSTAAKNLTIHTIDDDSSLTEITWAELKELRDNSNLVPGKYYRITDFVTTTKSKGVLDTNDMVASACHPFDIIVRADSSNVLNENAHAAVHEGDTYFANSNLSAWELKYKLDLDLSYLWALDSSRTFNALLVTHSNWNYLYVTIPDASDFHRHGVSNSILTDTSIDNISKLGMIDNNFYYRNSGDESTISNTGSFAVGDIVTDNHNDSYEIIDIGSITYEYRGIITYMKDEWGNECPYDFKNIQFKRWKATDAISGRKGLNGLYMVAEPNNVVKNLSVDDTEDYIWAYTFSSDNSGGEQTDYSLGGHSVHHNVFRENFDGSLPDNVMFGDNNYCNSFGFNCYCNSCGNSNQNNSWGNDCSDNSCGNSNQYNSWGNDCYNNSWGNNCQYNSWGNNCYGNSWDNNCKYNSWGNDCYGNSWGNNCKNNSWGNYCNNNSCGNSCYSNSWGNGCNYNSWGNGCKYNSCGNSNQYNSWGNNVTQSTLFEGVQYTQITTENVKNVQVLNGVQGTSSSKLTLPFAANKTYTQVACRTSAGALKIYVPGDLA